MKFSVALLAVVSSCLLLLFLSYPAHEKVASHSHNYHPNDHHLLHHNHNDGDDLLMLFVCHSPISAVGLGCQWDFKGFFGLEFSQTAKNTELFICEMMPMRNLKDVIMIMMVDHHWRLDGLLLGILHQVEQLVQAGMLPRLLLTR